MSSVAGLLALLSLLARAAWITAQTENPWMTTSLGTPPPAIGTTAGRPSGPPVGTPPPPIGTPFPPGACPYPSNASQISLVVFNGEPNLGNSGEIGSCGCDVGKKAFYNSGTSADPEIGATYATFVELPDNGCADLCIIDEAGNECKLSSASAPIVMFLQPYCARGKCHMYVYLYGDETGSTGLTCGTRNFTGLDGRNADGSNMPMDPDTSPQAYDDAAAFTCKGCAAIRTSNCLKPGSGTVCDRIESLVQVDAANSSMLTTSLNAAWNGWSRPNKANFALYKKRIENTVYEPIWSGTEKVSAASKILESYAPDGSGAKDIILAIPIAGWGTFCDFLNCAIRRGLVQANEKHCGKSTPTTVPLITTTPSSETCEFPKNTSQVGLVFLTEDEPVTYTSRSLGSCSCDVGKKAFYNSLPSNDPYGEREGTTAAVQYPTWKDVCPDLCIIDEAGDECRFSNTSAPMTILFQPYCVRGRCHMYVYMGFSGDETGSNGFICGSRNYTQFNQWNATGSMLPMDPDTSPQAYVHAAAFTCNGCAAIRNTNCLKPVGPPIGSPSPPRGTPRPPGGTPSVHPSPSEGMPSVPGGAPSPSRAAPSAPKDVPSALKGSASGADATVSPVKPVPKNSTRPGRQ